MPGTAFLPANWTGYVEATITNPDSDLTEPSPYIDIAQITDSDWRSNVQTDGADIRVTKGDNSELPLKLIDWDYNGGAPTGRIRAKWLSDLLATGVQTVRIWVGYKSGTALPYDANETYGADNAFDANYLSYFPSGGGTDQTQYGNDGTAVGGVTVGGVTGPLGPGTDFDGIDDQIELDESKMPSGTTAMTMYAWVNNGFGGEDGWLAFGQTAANQFGEAIRCTINNGALQLRVQGGAENWGSGVDDDTWQQVAITLPASATTADATGYINGVSQGSGSGTRSINIDMGAGSDAFIGSDFGTGNGDIQVAELSIHDTQRSAAWIDFEYQMVNDQAAFWGTWTWTEPSSGSGVTAEPGTGQSSSEGQQPTVTANLSVEVTPGTGQSVSAGQQPTVTAGGATNYSVTARGVNDNGVTGAASISLPTFTPSANSVLLVGVQAEEDGSGGVSASPAETPTATGLTFTQSSAEEFIGTIFQKASGLWRSDIGGSPSTVTDLTQTGTDDANLANAFLAIAAVDVTGTDGIEQEASAGSSNGSGATNPTLTLTLGAVGTQFQSGNLVVVFTTASADPSGTGITVTVGGEATTKVAGASNDPNEYEEIAVFYRELDGAESNEDVVATFNGTYYSHQIHAIEFAPGAGGGTPFTATPGTGQSTSEGQQPTVTVGDAVNVTTGTGQSTSEGQQPIVTAGAVPDTPAQPTIEIAGNGLVVIKWTAPANNGEAITAYDVEQNVNSGGWGDATETIYSENLDSGSQVAVLTGFSPGDSVQVRVAAINASGTSAPSTASAASAVNTKSIATSVSGRNVLDQSSNPMVLVGDAPWSAVSNLTFDEMLTYLTDRETRGCNAVYFNAPEEQFVVSGAAKGENQAGHLAFTGTEFQSTLNDDYWQYCDLWVDACHAAGITALLCPFYLGFDNDEGWRDEIAAASDANLTTYGGYLDTRYSGKTNIIWFIGHDAATISATEASRAKACYDALPAGHLKTAGGYRTTNASGIDQWNATADFADADFDLDFGYWYFSDLTAPANAETCLNAHSSPWYHGEGRYEGEPSTPVSETDLRKQTWSWLHGGCGAFFGNNPVWHFDSPQSLFSYSGTWDTNLNTTGTQHCINHLSTIAGNLSVAWSAMTAETTDSLFTATGNLWGRRDGTGALIYAVNTTALSLDLLSHFGSGTVSVTRHDPTDGSSSQIVTDATAVDAYTGLQGQGNNAAGDPDWLFELDFASGVPATTEPSTGQSASAGQQPSVAAGQTTEPTIGESQSAGQTTDVASGQNIEPGAGGSTTAGQQPIVDSGAANQEQSITTNLGLTIDQGDTGTVITQAILETTDPDNTPAELQYTLDSEPARGTLKLSGEAITLGQGWTQADINAGNLTYDHDGSANASDSFEFSVDDGQGIGSSDSFAITVNLPANVSPGAGGSSTAGQQPDVAGGAVTEPGAGGSTSEGQAPTVQADDSMLAQPGTGGSTTEGQQPGVSGGVVAEPGAGGSDSGGQAPTVETGTGVNITPGAGGSTTAGQQPQPTLGHDMTPGAGESTSEGQTAYSQTQPGGIRRNRYLWVNDLHPF